MLTAAGIRKWEHTSVAINANKLAVLERARRTRFTMSSCQKRLLDMLPLAKWFPVRNIVEAILPVKSFDGVTFRFVGVL